MTRRNHLCKALEYMCMLLGLIQSEVIRFKSPSLNTYLLYQVCTVILGTGKKAVKETDKNPCLPGVYILGGYKGNKQTNKISIALDSDEG